MCCVSGAQKSANISTTEYGRNDKTTNKPRKDYGHANRGAVNDDRPESLEVASSDQFGKFRYSGRGFDDIDLDSSKDVEGKEEKQTVDSLDMERAKQKSKPFRFTSTRRGDKRDSVYNKFSQF